MSANNVCVECKKRVVWYRDIQFCKDCAIWIYEHKNELLYKIDRLSIDLIDKIAELENLKCPENYSQIIINVRDYISKEIKKEQKNESEQVVS